MNLENYSLMDEMNKLDMVVQLEKLSQTNLFGPEALQIKKPKTHHKIKMRSISMFQNKACQNKNELKNNESKNNQQNQTIRSNFQFPTNPINNYEKNQILPELNCIKEKRFSFKRKNETEKNKNAKEKDQSIILQIKETITQRTPNRVYSLHQINNEAKQIEDQHNSKRFNINLYNFDKLSPSSFMSRRQKDKQETFYANYKQIHKISQQSKISKFKNSPNTLILQKQDQYNILPSRMGLQDQNDVVLKMNNFKFGNQYIQSLAEGLIDMQGLKQLKLDNNRITEKGADILLQKLPINLEIITLKNNQIGQLGCNHLSNYLSYDCLTELNLEDNKLIDENIELLIEGIRQNNSLKILNLSKNQISKQSCFKLSECLEKNKSILELYLHWNKICQQGGKIFFETLKENKTLRVLDLSWNEIGGSISAQKFAELIIHNIYLVHIDLSNNHFDFKQTQIISQALNQNRTLLGFHFSGHFGIVDQNQFLKVKNEKISNQSNIQRIKGVEATRLKKIQRLQDIPDQEVCWICDGWQQKEFFWPGDENPVYLHLEFEDFEGKYLSQNSQQLRMVPPQEFNYFFTVDDEQTIIQSIPSVETILEQSAKIYIQGNPIEMLIQQKNVKSYQQHKQILNQNYQRQIDVLPRTPQDLYQQISQQIQQKKWTIKKSLFKDWKKTSEETVQNCFEFDWTNNRIFRIIKDQDDLQKNIWVNYDYLECYKCYSILYPIGEVLAITINPYLLFINQINILNQYLTPNDITLKWAATTQNMIKKDNFRNPERGIVRFQFIEVITRLAEQKYCFSNICDSYSEAVEKLYNDHLKKEFIRCSTQNWRKERYWNEQVENVILKYKLTLDQIFNNLVKKRQNSKIQKTFLCIDDILVNYQNLQEMARMIEITNINEREIQECINQSIMLVVDELNQDRHNKLNMIEFYECVARLADKYQPQSQTIHLNGTINTVESQQDLSLDFKLERFIILLRQKICDIGNSISEMKVSRKSKQNIIKQ